jgi:DNA polymerase-1
MEVQRSLPKFIENPDPKVLALGSYIVVDLEVTNKEKGSARVDENKIVYGFARGSDGRQWDVYNLFDLREIPWQDYDLVIAHNAKFEFQWLSRAGVDTHQLLPFCTQIADYVIGGNRTGQKIWPVNLDACAKRRGLGQKDTVGKWIRAGICPSTIPLPLLRKYCRKDVDLTERLLVLERRELAARGLYPVLLLRVLFCPVVADLEMRGMHLDSEIVLAEDEALAKEESSLVNRMREIAGPINLRSWQQKAWFMYGDPKGLRLPIPRDKYNRKMISGKCKQFPDGAPSTDAEALRYLSTLKLKEAQQEWISLHTRFQKVSKLRSSYTKKFVQAVNGSDSILYGGLNQTVTKTHRLSSSPNLQNIARRLKRCFSPRYEDWKIANADYAQLEFRTAGVLANDKQVLEDIKNKADVHSYTASVIFGEDFTGLVVGSDARKEKRNQAKAHTFKPLYGGKSGTDDEVRYYTAFREKYPDITAMQQGWVDECLEHQKFRMVTGLWIYFPGTQWNSDGTFVKNSTKILNLPVQQFATADIAPLGVTLLWHYMHVANLKSFLVNEVHDSCIAEVHPDEIEQFRDLAKSAMVDDMIEKMSSIIGFRIKYPMAVDVEVKTNWDYNKEVKTNG